jgi:putative ABC transport system ATP-binding protein
LNNNIPSNSQPPQQSTANNVDITNRIPTPELTQNLNQSPKQLIIARNLRKDYLMGRVTVPALRGIDLEINSGEMVAVMGPSGCGKTTLLNCLAGLDEATSGEIWINGKLLNSMNDDERSRFRARHMGFIFQFYNLLPVLSALENVEMPMRIVNIAPEQARERAHRLLDQVGLSERAEHKPGELSGGQRQRVAIARALANEPLIVWADEPTGDLDSETSEEILELIGDLNKRNHQTFVLVTHDAKVAQKANRIIQMKNGIII